MPLISYHPTIIDSIVSSREAVDTTSSQIVLSRGVADPGSISLSTLSSSPATLASIFESPTMHIMTLADAVTPAERVLNSRMDRWNTEGLDTESYSHNEESQASRTPRAQNYTNSTTKASNTQSNSGYFTESQNTIRVVNTGKKDGADRGRTLERCPRYSNPLAFAESRIRNSEAAASIELDTGSLKRRASRSITFYDDPSYSLAILDDHLLEPCPHEPVCTTLSEILNSPTSSASFSATVSPTASGVSVGRHASLIPPMALSGTLNAEFGYHDSGSAPMAKVVPLTNNDKEWKGKGELKASDGKQPLSIAGSLPTEILHQIFYSLGPAEFHAARHTCRIWFITSLYKPVLEAMVRRGGYSGSMQRDLNANYVLQPDLLIDDEWLMSKRLARECALGPAWTGHGLAPGGVQRSSTNTPSATAFKDVSTVDFTDVAVHNPRIDYVSTVFTVSNCGRFLMAANGCLVYVYELNSSTSIAQPRPSTDSGALRPITSITCSHRVLACSMDTSSHRYAIAILLEGRMGLVCDITALNEPLSQGSHSPGSPSAASTGMAIFRSSFAPATDSQWYDIHHGDVPQFRRSSLRKAARASCNSKLSSIMPRNRILKLGEMTMPIETGPRSLYRNLCADDDPPRSVAICPQRRCVAFGCSSGIELHWVDALTGQDLNRWFPLTAPSDYLFFLPPRKSIDSAKKLRLISSAARPSEQPAIAERAFGRRHRNNSLWENLERTSITGESGHNPWNRQPFATKISGNASGGRAGFGRTELSDHYRAVPLSDGYHILFTDPVTGLLCLGSDAPVGGPTKLLRKFWFHGPEALGSPIVYASGSDLRWGVRVVAVFGTEEEQSVWLFTVPHDILVADESPNQSGHPLCTSVGSSKDPQNFEWLDWIEQVPDPISNPNSNTTWPVKTKGQEIGTFSGITDLAIDSGPIMTIWAFSKTGIAKVWTLDDGRNKEPKMALVVRDGTVRDVDVAGDVEMCDISPLPESIDSSSPPCPETFDGSTSLFSSVFPTRYNRPLGFELSQYCITYDTDGDVVMKNAGGDVLMEDLRFLDGLDEIDDRDFDHVVSTGMKGKVWFKSSRLETPSVVVQDMVEELTGIARIDIEIR